MTSYDVGLGHGTASDERKKSRYANGQGNSLNYMRVGYVRCRIRRVSTIAYIGSAEGQLEKECENGYMHVVVELEGKGFY